MKRQTLTTIAKAVIAEGGDQLAVRKAQLVFLQAKKNSASKRVNVFAWQKEIAYLESQAA